MATILAPEDIQRPGVAHDPGVTARPTAAIPSQFQDPTGSAIANFGESMQGISATFRELYKVRQDAEDRAFVDHYQLELNKTFPTIESEMLNSPASVKPDYISALDKRLQDRQKEVLDKLVEDGSFSPSQKGREAATHAAMQLREASARRSSVAAHNQRITSLATTIDKNVVEIARTAGASSDLQGGWDRVDSSVKSLEGVLAPDKYEAYRNSARSQVVENVVRGHMERGEFNQARSLIDRNRGFAANSQEGVIAAAASRHNIDPAFLVATARAESSGNPQAKASTSNASGLFQFVPETAVEYGLPADASQASVEQQADAAARLASSNRSILRNDLGRDPSSGELYLAHFLGARGAIKVLNAAPNAPAQSVVSPEAFRANASVMQGKSASDMVDWANGKIMAAGGGGAIQYMPEEKRLQLMAGIEAKQAQAIAQSEKRQEQYVKDVGEALMKEGYSRSDKGTLDNTFVEQAKTWVSSTNYKTLLNLSSTDEGNVDDNGVIQELTPLVHTDTPEEFQRKANIAFESKKLKASTFRAMVNGNQTAFKDDRPASPYKSGRDMINTTLDPGLMSGPASQVLRVGRANALLEFDNWISNPENAKKNREDVLNFAADVVRRYEPVSYGEMKLATGISRYFGRVTKSELSFESPEKIEAFISKAEDALAEDDAAGKLTKSQLDYEVRTIKTWQDILTRELSAKRRAEQSKRK